MEQRKTKHFPKCWTNCSFPLSMCSFAMTRQFYPVSGRYWFTLDSVQLESNGVTETFIGKNTIYAPAEYSFHCQSVSSFKDALLIPNITDGQTVQGSLNFINFQVCRSCSLILKHKYCFFKDTVVTHLFSDTDPGLQFGQWNQLLLRQRLCRFLHWRDLDGPAHLTAHDPHLSLRLAYDNAGEHHGSLWRPQRSFNFSASVRVKPSQHTHTCTLLYLRCLWNTLYVPCSLFKFLTDFFGWYF